MSPVVSARAEPELKESTNTDAIEVESQILANFILGTPRTVSSYSFGRLDDNRVRQSPISLPGARPRPEKVMPLPPQVKSRDVLFSEGGGPPAKASIR